MEKIQLISLDVIATNFMSMENGIFKNIKYFNEIVGRNFEEANICKKEGNTYYSHTYFTIRKSKNSYYLKEKEKFGFTINEKGKLKIWFGKELFQIPSIALVFKYFNFNWLLYSIYPFITKTIFEKMIANKITNNVDLIKTYLKLVKINCSSSLFLKILKSGASNSFKSLFLREASVATNVNHVLEHQLNILLTNERPIEFYEKSALLTDMIQEALILDRKINFRWSLNRLKEVHKKWSKEIMECKMDGLNNDIIPYVEKFDKYTYKEFKLLKTEKEVFTEGSLMNHCLYTVYWSQIQQEKYLAYHVSLNGEEATLGIYTNNNKLEYNQCFAKYNASISNNLKCHIDDFIENLNEKAIKDGLL